MSNDLAPIVLFVYNRLSHTKKTIEALQNNFLAKESELYIYSDATRNDSDIEKVSNVREYIKLLAGFRNITIIERERNFGLADNIIDGVTKVVNKHGKVIVLEDDIVTSPYFLSFMNNALNCYENNNNVWHVSGYLYPSCENLVQEDTLFLNVASCWGWATWKRSWDCLEINCNVLMKCIKQKDINKFNLDGSYDWYSHLKKNSTGDMKTWAIKWYVSLFINNAFCLHPKMTLTRNIGNDGSGEHCTVNDVYNNQKICMHKLDVSLIKIKESNLIRECLKSYFKGENYSYSRLVKK